MPTVDGGAYLEIEGVPGSAETLVAADAIDYHTLTFTEMTAPVERPVVRLDRWTPAQKLPWRTHWQVAGEFELKHLDTADDTVPPELHDLIQCCGWVYDNTDAATGVHVYDLSGDPGGLGAAFTVMKEMRHTSGLQVTAHGCAGNLVFEWPEGSEAVVRLEALGDYNTPIDQPTPLVGVYNAGKPATGITSATIHSYAAIVRSFTFDPAVELRERFSGNSLFFPPYLATSGPPNGEIVIELVNATAKDFHGLWEAATLGNWVIVSALGTAQITLTLTDVQIGQLEIQTAEPNTFRIPYTVHTAAELKYDTP